MSLLKSLEGQLERSRRLGQPAAYSLLSSRRYCSCQICCVATPSDSFSAAVALSSRDAIVGVSCRQSQSASSAHNCSARNLWRRASQRLAAPRRRALRVFCKHEVVRPPIVTSTSTSHFLYCAVLSSLWSAARHEEIERARSGIKSTRTQDTWNASRSTLNGQHP